MIGNRAEDDRSMNCVVDVHPVAGL